MTSAIHTQQRFWNEWNATTREKSLAAVSLDQAAVADRWLEGRSNLSLIDVGCGAGWMAERLTRFGRVTATDLADEVLARARARRPDITFVAGNFMALDFPPADVVLSFEVLAHVADQPAFIAKLASILKPGGMLILATQNPWVLRRCSWVVPQQPGHLRHWVGGGELRALLAPHFDVTATEVITPDGDQGILRLAASVKVNRLSSALLGESRVRRFKEWMGIGRTIMVRAIRR
jgi:2-polyprenyl-3-methyl-5-hydroxy-6-metoxy-1,4-benzoquinol methylase